MREKTGEGPNIQSWIPSLSPFRTCAGASMEGAEGWPWERGIKEENSGKKGQVACLSCGSKRGAFELKRVLVHLPSYTVTVRWS